MDGNAVAVWVEVGEAVAVGGTSTSWVGFNVEVGTGAVVDVAVGVPLA